MEFLNISITLLQRPEYVGAEPVQRSTWLSVIAWSARVENSGRIVGCRAWKDRQWQQTCGVTLAEIDEACDLWAWDDDDLLIWEYPLEQEAKVIRQREVARENGRSGGRPPKPRPETDPEPTSVSTLVPMSEPTSKPISESVREGNERKGKGRGEERASASPPPLDLIPQVARDGLAAMWPDAPRALDAGERQGFAHTAVTLSELDADDWQGLAAWTQASDRERNQKSRWPRDRAEFLRNVSEVVSKVRPWWRKQRPPKDVMPFPPPAASEPEDTTAELQQLLSSVGLKSKSP